MGELCGSPLMITNHTQARLTYCPLCLKPADEIAVGEIYKYYEHGTESFLGFGHPGGPLAHMLIRHNVDYDAKPARPHERVPAGAPCVDCQVDMHLQQSEFEDVVAAGGVRWICLECHLHGVVVPNDHRGFSASMRQQFNVAAPDPLTVKFSKCELHESEDDKGLYEH